jgi:hypothetical protein
LPQSLSAGERVQPNLKVTPAADFVHNLSQIRQSQAVAWASSAIAIVIGAIGILNNSSAHVKLLSRLPNAAGLVEGKIDIAVVGQGICCPHANRGRNADRRNAAEMNAAVRTAAAAQGGSDNRAKKRG